MKAFNVKNKRHNLNSYVVVFLLGINVFLYHKYFIDIYKYFRIQNEYIVVSFTTTPQRINNIQPTVATILKQFAPIKKIYINIPYISKRTNQAYTVPEWLQNDKHVTILRTNDYGPATKLLGVLSQVKLPKEAIIITVDDDVYYPRNLVLQLAYAAKQRPNAAVGISGADPNYDAKGVIGDDLELGLIKRYDKTQKVAVLQGYGGIAYRAKFFQADVFAIADMPPDCIYSDDLFFSFYLEKYNVQRWTERNPNIQIYDIKWGNPLGTGSDALHKQTPLMKDRYRSCLLYLQQQNPQVVFY